MNTQVPTSTKGGFGCLAVIVLIALSVTFAAVGSLNVLSVYSSGHLWAEITISILGAFLLLGISQIGQVALIRRVISSTSGRSAEDVRCPGCGEPLLTFTGAYGPPVRCPGCKRWWHRNICFRKGAEPKGRVWRCPDCRSIRDRDDDLFGNDGFPP